MNRATSTEAQIQAVADTLLAEARAGTTRPSISALAERAGISRPTLYRNHPVLVERFRAASADSRILAAPLASTPTQELRERITTLRRENEQLRLHVELYEEHIRRLTVENTRLASELAARSGVSDLTVHQPRNVAGQ
ncbi:hypothetical protein [Amycolatopsis minnesotensis]|uniref:TetR family transcriptional regulator n=1 Tax=Amycolatopsis minnesotensis TaxID=337894 RepID=A0ABN2QRH2_9PSEU